jgi:hypothetical protein
VDGDVIDFDTALDQEFFGIAVGESVAEVPTDSQHDHLGWEPVASEGGAICRQRPTTAMSHLGTLAG